MGMPEGRGVGQVVALDRLIGEAVLLAVEARDYIAVARHVDAQNRNLDEAVAFALETTRLAGRVAACVAWLLARRAVLAGEIDEEQARAPDWRLQEAAVCRGRQGEDGPLPERLRRLLARSAALYERIDRLDAQLDQAAGDGAA